MRVSVEGCWVEQRGEKAAAAPAAASMADAGDGLLLALAGMRSEVEVPRSLFLAFHLLFRKFHVTFQEMEFRRKCMESRSGLRRRLLCKIERSL